MCWKEELLSEYYLDSKILTEQFQSYGGWIYTTGAETDNLISNYVTSRLLTKYQKKYKKKS